MGLTLTFDIKLQSDYHVGAGFGHGGGIDSALHRDRDGVPVLRGTVVTGLLRDALWRLLQLGLMHEYRLCVASGLAEKESAYCGQEKEIEQKDGKASAATEEICPICRLFGSPVSPKRWRISSARPVGLTEIGAKGSQDVPGHVAHRARISPRTRRAAAGKLFSEEEGDGRLRFRFQATTTAEDEAALDEAALLVAAARNLRELGRSRRRGRGECLLQLDESSVLPQLAPAKGQTLQDALLDRFKAKWLDVENTTLPSPVYATYAIPAVEENAVAGPIRLRLVVRTDEPVLVARRAEVGNQFETVGVVSGSAVRGALAQQVAVRFNLHDPKSNAYKDFRRLFLRQAITFPTLLPARLIGGSQLVPTIPAPMNLVTCKTFPTLSDAQKPHWHGPQWDDQINQVCPKCAGPLTSFNEKYLPVHRFSSLNGKIANQPDERTEMHIAVEPTTGRVAQSELFGYVALDAGQYFMSELVCADRDAWARLQALTGLREREAVSLRIGKATRRGYGRVTAWLEPLQANDPATSIASSTPISQRLPDAPAAHVVLTLLTDAIVTDQWGRFRQGFEEAWLGRELGLGKGTFTISGAWATSRVVDGFNAHLGLPRWRDVALKAGSAVVLHLEKPPAVWEAILAAVEQRGIGLRRNEGFGRVAFNHPVYNDCAGLTRGYKAAAAALPLSNQLSTHTLVQEKNNRWNWQRKLDNLNFLPYLKNERGQVRERACDSFAALAAWLHARREATPTTLAERLNQADDNTFGKPDETLRQKIGKDEYGARTKDNFFEADGVQGRQRIVNHLQQLSTEYPATFWPEGITMLAEIITAAVTEARS